MTQKEFDKEFTRLAKLATRAAEQGQIELLRDLTAQSKRLLSSVNITIQLADGYEIKLEAAE
jgi:hypothetical protein